ncbi:glycosyltransferase family 10 [Aliisedimentitalea scapharcae]|uniref:Glycosyltransferase family 10 n=1 Tax=Aliisedimentitalea scapharcae TaxID=1524259 RepID=A0ABZ2Y0A9_9RHOB
MDMTPAIAVLPYGMKLGPGLGQRPVSDLNWPLGCPERLQGRQVADLLPTDHLIVFPRTNTHFQIRYGTQARISLILGEPSVIHAKHLRLLRLTHRRFYKVLTFSDYLLTHLPNAYFFPLGTTWVPEWRDLPLRKTEMCSLIASAKRDSSGHKLRHHMVEWVRGSDHPVAVMGRGYTPFDAKSDGLAPYRYSIVIENVQEKNYFSEKLVDAVLCNTVPIYWGCPNLDHFMDISGIIQCNSAADIQRAVETMSEDDFVTRLPKLQAIHPVLERYCDLDLRAAVAIRDSL